MKMAVLGAGSWGTAFSVHLAKCGHEVLLWGRKEEFMKELKEKRENKKYLPMVKIPKEVECTSKLDSLEEFGDVVFIAVPSHALRGLMEKVKETLSLERLEEIIWVSLVKGLEFGEGKYLVLTMSDIIKAVLGEDKKVLALSGPSHAEEVAREIPTTVILAGNKQKAGETSAHKDAQFLREAISNSYFRAYSRPAIGSIEICGGAKNPLAIGAGIAQGLGKYGDNTLAALVCRGANEIARLLEGLRLDKKPAFGLAGIGDLIATCRSSYSRNHRYGLAIGEGEEVEPGTIDGMVVEGYYAVKEIRLIKEKLEVEMPITEQVYQVLYKGKDPEVAIYELMERNYKEESFL